MASHSGRREWTYDVFLSYRGADTGASFISNLRSSLTNARIRVFQEVGELRKGDEISTTISQAIRESRISLVVFSKEFARSRWCLQEVAEIMECHRNNGQVVVPVFYGVHPSEVRNQKYHFGEAFGRHEERVSKDETQIWRTALNEACKIYGFDLSGSPRNEGEVIENIVGCVSNLLDTATFLAPEYQLEHEPETYDVFLSLRGTDTRGTFASLLYKHLTNAGFLVYLDEVELQKGKDISTSIFQAIQASRISVVILSHDYASSSFCLRELEKIMKCCRTEGQKVLPVFYDVNPSDVRHHRHYIADSLLKYEKRGLEDQVKPWKAALTEAANISGFDLRSFKSESEAMDKIVEAVASLLHSTESIDEEYQAREQSRVQDVIQLLNYQKSDNVILLGICGEAGIGKTTIVKAVYDKISQNFEVRKFFPHIGEAWTNDSLVFLQEELLSCVDEGTIPKIQTIQSGKLALEESLHHRKVFLVLEDVTRLDQAEALCQSRKWCGPGSRIIITSRDRYLLEKIGDEVYTVMPMSDEESIELFSSHAFKKETPEEDYRVLVWKTVPYCRGLPLLLKVLGSHFFGMSITEWEHELILLERIPSFYSLDILKIVFDRLSDQEKETFFDVACFFLGMDVNNIVQSLNDSRHYVDIRVLTDRSILIVDEENKLQMHHLLRDMARGIMGKASHQTKQKLEKDILFLNFFGNDTHAAFSSHLQTSLEKSGINIFKDEIENEQQRGEQVSITRLKAIRESRLSIIIFSRNYFHSTWCLLELESIIECYKTKDQVVVPVFYDVDPQDLLKETGIFREDFQNLLHSNLVSKEKVLSWRNAIREASGIPGFVVQDSMNIDKDIKKVVESITRWLNRTNLFVSDHKVGVEDRVQYLIKSLNEEKSDDVTLLGIWGMGGIGKTIIAKALYNQIGCDFEGSSFLPNIRKAWQNCSHTSLQECILSDIYLTKDITIPNIKSGIRMLEKSLHHRKVLVVLDDVNKAEQLEALCGSGKWFGPGSIVIITTRNRRLLDDHGVKVVHRMREMDGIESTELFSWHAFKQATPRQDFAHLCRDAVSYCGGLPLALAVLGSEMFGKEMTKCERVLEKLKEFPHPAVQDVLRISFDDLNDDKEKDLFLDLSFFFVGMDHEDVIHALKGYGHSVDRGITNLVDQSLVTVNDKFEVHVLLRQMGKEIFRERSRMDPGPKIYDVFLSFRGEDTRASFTSHLCTALQNAGINVFKDDETMRGGDQISVSLLEAIVRSRVSVIVLSEKYANSRWCMIELEKIMECRRTTNQLVVPVFYGVDPSELRNLKGMIAEAFNDLLNRIKSVEEDKVSSWKTALAKVGAIKGPVIVTNYSNESENIKRIVEDVTGMLDRTDLSIASHPVGVESRVEDVIRVLDNHKAKDILFLGIWGMGGMGKTTIAKALYNQIGHEFEGRSFLLDVREEWKKTNGPVSLQNKLLSHIFKTTKAKIDNIEEGKLKLEESLCQKAILVVLDDVDKREQLNALCGSYKWFRAGSRIIITTRNRKLAKIGIREEDLARVGSEIYTLKQMEETESIELFSWHAFKEASPSEEFRELSGEIVSYSGGLPLALEVLGCHLYDKKSIEWEAVLEKLRTIPNNEIQKKLRISFDGLSDDKEKAIFLDIACFFIGMDQNDVTQILDGCGLFAKNGLSVLVERSLVVVDNSNRLGMHDLLRDMGREIIREERPNEPGTRGRLWKPEEALHVLKKARGGKNIEGLALRLLRTEEVETKAFEKMIKLRLLQLAGVKLVGNFKYVSGDLRWLSLQEFPFRDTPKECDQGNLVAIELEYNNLTKVWQRAQMLEKLKTLNLSHSRCLRQTPDFSKLPNLEKLILKDCQQLSSVSETIEHLKELLILDLQDCISLLEVPRSIYKLKTLKELNISGCVKIDKLEEDLEQMDSLTTLKAENTGIIQVPYALPRLKNIGYISVCGYRGFAKDVIPSIIFSWISPTNQLSCLVHSSSSGEILEESNSQLQMAGDVNMDSVTDRLEMEMTSSTSQVSQTNTFSLIQGGSSGSKSFSLIQMGRNCPVAKTLKQSIFQRCAADEGSSEDCSSLHWLTFSNEGSSVTFEVPQMDGRNLKTVMLCIVHPSSPDSTKVGHVLQRVFIMNRTKNTYNDFALDKLTSMKDEDWHSIISNLEAGNKVEIVVLGSVFNVNKIAVYLIYAEPSHHNLEHSHTAADNDTMEMKGDKNIIVPGNAKNRFQHGAITIPSFFISPPFWFGLAAFLIWKQRQSHKRRRSN